jgi:class 3 adenylate cyclase
VTRYAPVGADHVAYQVSGNGSIDVLFIPEFATHVEMMWDEPHFVRVLERLQDFGRLITFDKRGTGLSDPVAVAEATMVENWVADAIAVLDAVGSRRVAVVAAGMGVPAAVMMAATYPRRTIALVLLNGWVRLARADDFAIGHPPDLLEAMPDYFNTTWGTGDELRYFAPGLAGDSRVVEWYGRYTRNSSSRGMAVAVSQVSKELDLRSVLASIQVPTMVMHRERDIVLPSSHGRYIAEHISGAELRVLPGDSHVVFGPDCDEWLDEAEQFITGRRGGERINRVLTTMLFTDLVASTATAERLGDGRWKEVLDEHDAAVRAELARFSGKERENTGDGFLSTFAGPAHAIRCAIAIGEAVRELGLEIRAGVHTGEIEVRSDGNVGGIGVHIASRVMDAAGGSEVMVSRTVVDLVAGSGLEFVPRGEHTLKGVSGTWQLYSLSW